MKKLVAILLSLICGVAFAKKPPLPVYVKISTTKGDCIVLLYDKTPAYRDNFVKLVKSKFYDGTLFHRVIKGFMIQGGDPNSKTAKDGDMLGNGGVNYTIPANFQDSLYHKKGALAAARDNNPEKASSGCQFYIVQGKTYTEAELSQIEQSKGLKYFPYQRDFYKNYGGTPFLDQNYTVFGEVVKGLELIDAITAVKTDGNDRPEENIVMNMQILKKREVKKLEKELLQEMIKSKIIMK